MERSLERTPSNRTREERDNEGLSWLDLLDYAEPLLWAEETPGGFLVFLALGCRRSRPVRAALFLFVVEVLLVVLVATIGIILRVALRRPWLVEAFPLTGAGDRHFMWKIAGVRRSGLVVEEVAQQIRTGVAVPLIVGATLVERRSGKETLPSGHRPQGISDVAGFRLAFQFDHTKAFAPALVRDHERPSGRRI